jgi:prepilin-type processing-associated H-X9-DG protein
MRDILCHPTAEPHDAGRGIRFAPTGKRVRHRGFSLAELPAVSKGKRAAFSLAELLVVIGIIGVLISMLLPALAGARRSSQQIKCAANLRTLGQAMVMCANEHRGFFPLGGTLYPQFGTVPCTPVNLGDATRQRYTYFDNGGGDFLPTAIPAALAPYLGNQSVRGDSWQDADADLQAQGPLQDAFICPADQPTIDRSYPAPQWISAFNTGNYLNGWSSYGFNAEVLGWADNGADVGGQVYGHSRLRGCLVRCPHSTDTMLFCDSAQQEEIWVHAPQLHLGDVVLGTGMGGAAPHGSVFDLIRHRGSINILYVDGHVDSQPILNTTSLTWPANPQPSGSLLTNVSMDIDFPND